jgi:hypothetical protein
LFRLLNYATMTVLLSFPNLTLKSLKRILFLSQAHDSTMVSGPSLYLPLHLALLLIKPTASFVLTNPNKNSLFIIMLLLAARFHLPSSALFDGVISSLFPDSPLN